ncbi:endoribonuclease ysh1 [Xylographa soralifera]|nr:endoribonuclease ysh1 [Xylographa soralifera]
MSPEVEETTDPDDELMFLCLGGGNEVGRSCHIIQYKGKTVMLDAGAHPAFHGLASLPYFDEFDLSTVDILLISQYVIILSLYWDPLLYRTDEACLLREHAMPVQLGKWLGRWSALQVEICFKPGFEAFATSFHIDHAASVPYVLAKTNFRGRVFMTHPTKAIYKWLILDSVRVSNTSSSSELPTQLYSEADHLSTFPRIEAIDYYTTHTISSIRVTPYPAGHVLGAAMFLIEIAGLKILFTGDYSREDDRHLVSAEVPKNVKIDVLITESTYGIASHIPRVEREAALMKSITSILNRGGRVLMPVFALGRAQELLLILDEYWARHPEYHKIPIYYASNLAKKCMVVYQTYVGAMNDNIKRLFRERMAEAEESGDISKGGPWDFRYVRWLKNLERFDDVGGCVVLASPGMMQNGISRNLLERWAPSDRNGVVITGYSVEGTMAKTIMQEPENIPAIMGNRSAGAIMRPRGPGGDGGSDTPTIPRRCSVEEFSFAAHVDGVENREFIEDIAAPVVILVHGEKHNMMRLKSKLLSLNADKTVKTKIFSPANTEELRIPFKVEKTAKVVGKLAQISPPNSNNPDDGQLITGVLVQNDFKLSLMAPEDLREYAGLTTTTIMCKQRITLGAAGIELIRWALEGTFGSIEEIGPNARLKTNGTAKTNGIGVDHHDEVADEEINRQHRSIAFLIMGCVIVQYQNGGEVTIEWEGNVLNDGIADAVMAVLFTVESSPAAVKRKFKDLKAEVLWLRKSLESAKLHENGHSHDTWNPHADITSEERLSRLCMFLEAQFGPSLSPISKPKLATKIGAGLKTRRDPNGIKNDPGSSESEEDDVEDLAELEAEELERLHGLGIPVPGLEIKVDKYIAKVWLETLEVECNYTVLRDRVKAVVERAVETVAPLWGYEKP